MRSADLSVMACRLDWSRNAIGGIFRSFGYVMGADGVCGTKDTQSHLIPLLIVYEPCRSLLRNAAITT